MKEFKNSDGTYNGVKALSYLSGISESEILKSFNRVKELKALGHTTEQIKVIMKQERLMI